MKIRAIAIARTMLGTLGLGAVAAGIAQLPSAEAGPLVRRAQERRACQEFAGQLQAAQGNPQQAQFIYQQGVLQLVERFGVNPCGDIPVPTAASPAAPGTTAAPQAAPSTAPVAAPVSAPAASPAANPQQAQACQEFAGKLQAAQGNPQQARQIYAMGSQKLSGMFGPNPCPQISAP